MSTLGETMNSSENRLFNIVVYGSKNVEYLEYRVLYPGSGQMLIGHINSGYSLELEGGGRLYIQKDKILAIEVREDANHGKG